MRRVAVVTAVGLVLAAGSAWAQSNPFVKLAMHLIASDEYLYCDDFTFTGPQDFDTDLTLSELAASNYCGYVVFVAYDLSECVSGVEYFVRGWPMGRGAPVFLGPEYCGGEDFICLGEPFEALGGHGGIVGLAACLWDPAAALHPFASIFFDLSAYPTWMPIELYYGPSSYSYPTSPHNYVLGWWDEDATVEEHGCTIGGCDPSRVERETWSGIKRTFR